MSLEDKLRRTAGWLGAFVSVVGLIALIGGLSGTDPLGSLRPSILPMKIVTAACLFLAGGALFLRNHPPFAHVSRIGAMASWAIALAALLAGYLPALSDFGSALLRLIGRPTTLPAAAIISTRLGVALTAITLAIVLLHQHRASLRKISAWLANFVFAAAMAGLIGRELIGFPGVTTPFRYGLHEGLALILLSGATILARPEAAYVRTLFSESSAGLFARRLFLGVAVVPLGLAVLFVGVLNRDLLGPSDAVALLAIGLVFSGFAVSLFSIGAIVDVQEEREESEQARLLLTARLQEQAAQLHETVSRRTQELRDANASLRAAAESNALLALVAQHSTNGVIITDADGRIEWVNAAFTAITGFELQEIRGRKPGHFLQGPETDPATVRQLRESESRGTACRVEILNYRKNGTTFWQIVDMQPVRDHSGRLINFVANQTDITSERLHQGRLEHLNQRFALATRAAELGVWEWDAVTQQHSWDERTLEIYGIRAEDFKGTFEEWSRRIHPQDFAAAAAQMNSIKAIGDNYEHEFRIIRANDGAERQIQSRAIAQRDEHGKLFRITGTDRDVTVEREATQNITVLNERLRLALRSSSYGVWEYDILTGRRNWDERVLEIFGRTAAEFDGSVDFWLNALHPEDRAPAALHLRQVVIGELPEYKAEFRVVRPDGTVRYVESNGYVQRDPRGKPVRLVGLKRDVTEARQMAQALELAEQRWQLAIEGTNDSIWDWSIETGSIFHDERWAHMLGYPSGGLKSTIDGWKSLVHPDDVAANEAAVAEHLAGRASFYQHELRMRAMDGTWRWILDRGKVVRRTAEGRPLRMVGTHTDITARKELEERLQKTEALANEVSRLAQIGGWEFDFAQSRVTWTEGARRIFQVEDNFHPTLASAGLFFPPEAFALLQATFARATPEEPSIDLVVPLLTAKARQRWVRILGRHEFRHHRAIRVHGAIQDVTEQHEGESSRRELEAQLFQAQKMETLGTLAGGIAHDFNNLLTGIIGYHELAADSVPDDHPARLCLSEARNASLRARELVEQILTFGRQGSGVDHGPLDLAVVVEEARRFLRSTVPANIAIDVACTPECGLVLADATQIHQVLLNLGSNAAHAMRHHGGALRIELAPAEISSELALSLGAAPANRYVCLSVSDTGHGMDESTRRRIFDPFFTTKNSREGTGLGLAVVHGIVRSHRGAIDVESAPGQGATFHIYLPTADEDNPQGNLVVESAPFGEGEFVCVVDDEEVVASCTKLVLENRGYRALVFDSAEQYLSALQTNPRLCSVLLTDQTMPGMQGTQLAAEMRRTIPGLPVVIMSGYFSKISPQALDELGQVELLAKPFTTDELGHALHRALHPPPTPD